MRAARLPGGRLWIPALLLAALAWHLLSVSRGGWDVAQRETHARDFASYYYAAKVAGAGGDPYDRGELEAAARADGTRRSVYPYLYPPAFLLAMRWTAGLELGAAYRIWFWLQVLFLWTAALCLWRWWRELGAIVPVAVAGVLAIASPVTDNLLMGQANLLCLALVVAGIGAEARGRGERGDGIAGGRGAWVEDPAADLDGAPGTRLLGGALVGAAAMVKMTPALFVAWWLMRRRWTAAASAVAAAAALSLLSLFIHGFEIQRRFFLEVLPRFASGGYHELDVSIGIFGNVSVPALLSLAFPEDGGGLSGSARLLSIAFAAGLLAGLTFLLRREPADRLAAAGQFAAVALAPLLVPLYVFGHHLVWALPAAALAIVALHAGRLSPRWIVPVAVAIAGISIGGAHLRAIAGWAVGEAPLLAVAVRLLRTAAVALLLASSLAIARSRPEAAPPGAPRVGGR